MLTQEDAVDAHALRRQGWTITAIARHLGHDRKTIRAYLAGGRVAGQRVSSEPDPFEPFAAYCVQRLTDDPHVWATTLFDEVVGLGFDRSYPSFTRGLRRHRIRPHCEPCSASNGRDHTVIEHPPGEEIQWDWLELPEPPAHWNCGDLAHLLVGSLPSSGKWRAVLADSEDQPHLIDGLHAVSGRLGGVPKQWRFDRMATVVSPNTGRVTASFAAVAKHYGVAVKLCPPRHGNRKGSVEKSNDTAAQRWWRTVPDDFTMAQAQVSLDALCARVGDSRLRQRDGQRTTVGALAAAEAQLLGPLPPAYPATLRVDRVVSAQALVAFRGNHYSVPPGLAGVTVTVSHRLGEATLDITIHRPNLTGPAVPATVLARHRREPDGAGVMVRDTVHVTALQTAVLAAFNTAKPCHRKARRPPSVAALAEAEHLEQLRNPGPAPDREVVVDLRTWERAAHTRQVAP
jgi:transposase